MDDALCLLACWLSDRLAGWLASLLCLLPLNSNNNTDDDDDDD